MLSAREWRVCAIVTYNILTFDRMHDRLHVNLIALDSDSYSSQALHTIYAFSFENLIFDCLNTRTCICAMLAEVILSVSSSFKDVLISVQNFLLLGMDSEPLSMADFILAVSFAASSVTIVSGAMAERCKLPAYFFFSACMGGIVYPLAAHW